MAPPAWFVTLIEGADLALTTLAAFVVFAGTVDALLRLPRGLGETRRRFSRALLFALDVLIGADALEAAIAPSLQAALTLGVVVIIRVALALVVEYELRAESRGSMKRAERS